MSPQSGWGRTFPSGQRRLVQGGVVVAKPGRVSQADAVELLAQAEAESDARMLARGRTYARQGQVVALVAESGRFSAQIQGTAEEPYRVSVERTVISGSDRVAATCSCPYGCDIEWCKHACALAYAAAFLLERDAAARAAWTAEPESVDQELPDSGSTDEGQAGRVRWAQDDEDADAGSARLGASGQMGRHVSGGLRRPGPQGSGAGADRRSVNRPESEREAESDHEAGVGRFGRGELAVPVPADLLQALRRPVARLDVAAMIARASAIAPRPGDDPVPERAMDRVTQVSLAQPPEPPVGR